MSTTFATLEISPPVLLKSTSHRVEPLTDDVTSLPPPPPELLLNKQDNKGLEIIQTKYASPENNAPPISGVNENESNLRVSSLNPNTGIHSAFSDTSSDISDATTSAPSGSSISGVPPIVLKVSPPVELTEQDLNQVETFYKAQKTDVIACRCLANLYLSTDKNGTLKAKENFSRSVSQSSNISKDDWEFSKTGIPLLIHDTGEHHRTKNLRFVLAEKGTGFTLWQSVIKDCSNYNTPHTNFHTFSLAEDSVDAVGFSFDEADSAKEFADTLYSLAPKTDDESKSKKKKGKKKEKKSKQKYKAPKKNDISQPCCFVHVTKLERPSLRGVSPVLFPPPPSGNELSPGSDLPRAFSQSSGISECSTALSDH